MRGVTLAHFQLMVIRFFSILASCYNYTWSRCVIATIRCSLIETVLCCKNVVHISSFVLSATFHHSYKNLQKSLKMSEAVWRKLWNGHSNGLSTRAVSTDFMLIDPSRTFGWVILQTTIWTSKPIGATKYLVFLPIFRFINYHQETRASNHIHTDNDRMFRLNISLELVLFFLTNRNCLLKWSFCDISSHNVNLLLIFIVDAINKCK